MDFHPLSFAFCLGYPFLQTKMLNMYGESLLCWLQQKNMLRMKTTCGVVIDSFVIREFLVFPLIHMELALLLEPSALSSKDLRERFKNLPTIAKQSCVGVMHKKDFIKP